MPAPTGFRQVYPGLYERIDDPRLVKVTREFVEKLSRPHTALRRLLDAMLVKQETEVPR